MAAVVAGSAASEWGTEMAYDINAALSPFDALGAISSGQQAMQGFQTLRNNAQTMRSRAAMARALQGDRNAMADVQDPEMLAKLQEHFRQLDIREGIRGFYNTLDQDRIGVNNLATLASAKPKGFDTLGAAQYTMSQGGFEEAKPLLELAKLSSPEVAKWIGNPYEAIDATGNPALIGMTTAGPQPIPGYTPRSEKPMVSSGRIVRYGPGNEPVVENLPMTPAEQAAAGIAQRRADLEAQRVEIESQRALKTKPDMTPYQRIQIEGGLRDDFRADSKSYTEIKRQASLINSALKDPSAAGTLAAATAFMKMLDPGSVVRESELGMALAATGMTDRIMNYANIIQSGKVLTAQQRNEFTSLTREFLQQAEAEHSKRKAYYKDTAESYGLNPSRIIGREQEHQGQQKSARDTTKATNWLKSRNIKTQSQFNDAVIELRKRGWTDDEIRAASEGM